MNSSGPSLSVLVVGGGIGGLTAALSLRRAGHKVKVYERTDFCNEIGAAVTIASSVGIILQQLGVDFTKARFCTRHGTEVVNGATLEVLRSENYDAINASPGRRGVPDQTAHRAHFHSALRALAAGGDGDGPPCQLFPNATVVDYDPDNGTVFFSDGKMEQADLVIAADGVRSKALSKVLQQPDIGARSTNTTAICFLLRTADILADPITAPILSAGKGWCSFYIPSDSTSPTGSNVRRNGGWYATVKDADKLETRFTTDRVGLRKEFEGFHPCFGRIVDMAKEVLPLWRCTRGECVWTFGRGRMVVIGDAAHAMLPHIGGGAINAIQDSGALGVLFNKHNLPDKDAVTISERLELYNQIRAGRIAASQLYSDIPFFEDGVAVQRHKCEQFLPPAALPQSRSQLQSWLQHYKVLDHADEILQKHMRRS